MAPALRIQEILAASLDFAHRQILEGTIEGVNGELANRAPGGSANPIGTTYAHVVLSEDFIVNGMLRAGEPLSETSWAGRTGVDRPMPWSSVEALAEWYRSAQVDLPGCRAYAEAVHEASTAFLSEAADQTLAREVDMFGMKMPAATAFEIFVIGHANSIAGEISALKGMAGLKGYPF